MSYYYMLRIGAGRLTQLMCGDNPRKYQRDQYSMYDGNTKDNISHTRMLKKRKRY